MTISPAQAVWVTYEQILENECVVTDTDKKALAAAIRVAAEELQYMLFLPGNDVRVVDAEALFDLANELEAL
jgi:hypothetical protein